jgi:putative tricarboxylic transport membrane protein
VKRADTIAGIVLIGLGIFVVLEALKLDYASEYGPGPGFLPLWLGIGFLALASPLVVTSVARPSEEKKNLWRGAQRAIISWAGLVVSVALLKSVGFVLSFTLLAVFLVWVVDRRSPFTGLTVAVSSAFTFYLIFSVALGLPLPRGPWGF